MTTTTTIDLTGITGIPGITATLDLDGVFAALAEIGLTGTESVANQPQPQSIRHGLT